jgi:hypothetical protein
MDVALFNKINNKLNYTYILDSRTLFIVRHNNKINILRCKISAMCETCNEFSKTSVDTLYRKFLKNKKHLCYYCGFKNFKSTKSINKYSKTLWKDPLYKQMVSSGNKIDKLIKKLKNS